MRCMSVCVDCEWERVSVYVCVCVCVHVCVLDGAFPLIHAFRIMLSVVRCRMSFFVCFQPVFSHIELWTMRRIDRRKAYPTLHTNIVYTYIYILLYIHSVVAAFETHLIIVMLCIRSTVVSRASTISHYTLHSRENNWLVESVRAYMKFVQKIHQKQELNTREIQVIPTTSKNC